MKNTPQGFEERAKASLEASLTTIDADIRNRLAKIRANALNAKKSEAPSWFQLQHWLPASSLAFCGVLVLFFMVTPNSDTEPAHRTILAQSAPQNAPLADEQLSMLEQMSNADDLEIISDPDFYVWADVVLNDEQDNKNHQGNDHAA